MANQYLVDSPYSPFTIKNQFKAISNGSVYIGEVDKDPLNPLHQTQVYVVDETGSNVPVSQPIQLNAGGYLVYNGQVSKFVTLEPYSMVVLNSVNAEMWRVDDISKVDPDNITASTVPTSSSGSVQDFIDTNTFKTVAEMKAFTNHIVGNKVVWQGYYTQSDGGSNWGVVKTGAHVDDGFSVFSIDSNTYIEANLKGEKLNVRKAGAKGNKIDDDKARINVVKNYAQASIVGRFDSGKTVYFPNGDYVLTSTIEVTSSRISFEGESWSGTVLYAPNANFDLVHFNGTALSLYGCSISKIRFNTPNNATAGAQLRCTKLIDADLTKLQFVGHYKGLVMDGCARTFIRGVIFTQDTRASLTSPSYAMDFASYNGANNSDVHVATYQIFMPDDRKTPYSVSIRGADGIYFNNGHQQGGTLIQPDGEGSTTTASVFWSQVYLDKADVENIIFTGSAANYRQFEFNGVYLRGSVHGMVVNTSGLIDDVKFIGGDVANHTKNGIEFRNANSRNFKIVGTGFRDNASSNVLGDSDIILRGNAHTVSSTTHSGGSNNGRAVNITSDATNCKVDADVTNSTMGLKIVKSSPTSKLGVITGYTAKNRGSATVLSGTNSITVAHGMSVAPINTEIQVTPRTSLNGAVDFWIANVNSTTFDILVTATPSNNIVFTWQIDATG